MGLLIGRVLFWFVVLVGAASAQTVCYDWSVIGPAGFLTVYVRTHIGSEFCSQALAYWKASVDDGAGPAPFDNWTLSSCSVSGVPTGVGQSIVASISGPLSQQAMGTSAVMSECPPPPGCDTDDPQVGTDISWSGSSMSTGGDYCHAVSQCKVSVSQSTGADGSVVFTGHVTSQNCDSGAPSAEDPQAGESCTPVGDGEYCASPNAGDGSCGYVNDSFVCLSKVAQDECKPLADGGAVCGASAGTPPAPDNGTRGEPAAPDGEIEHNAGGSSTTNTYNYFNSTTVTSSSVATGDGSNPQDSGGSPSGNAGGGEGEGEGGECVGPDCTVSMPSLEDVGTFREAVTGFWSRLGEVPLVEAVSGITASLPTETCPDWSTTFNVFGQSFEVDFVIVCDLWADIAPLLSAAALALWGLLAVRVFLSA